MNKNLQHIRFNTGEEVICEIMEWSDEEDFILVRNAMAIETNLFDNAERMYMFRPWMLYIEKPHEILFVKKGNIVAHIVPNDLLTIQYLKACEDMYEIAEDRIKDHNRREALKLKAMVEQIADLKKEGKQRKEPELPDNVIPFSLPDDDTIH